MNVSHRSAPETVEFSTATLQRFAHELAKYPTDQKQSAVIACLSILQQENGFVSPEQEKALAVVLDMPVMAVHEVFTFYNMFNLQPVGQFKINVCTNPLANCAVDKKPLSTCVKSWALNRVRPPPMVVSLCNPVNAWVHVPMRLCCWSTIVTCAVSWAMTNSTN